jgi:hypothetical protein
VIYEVGHLKETVSMFAYQSIEVLAVGGPNKISGCGSAFLLV